MSAAPENENDDREPEIGQSFGAELRRLRGERGVSLTTLSRLVYYNKGYLSRVENGQRPASVRLASRCDQALAAAGALANLVPEQPARRRGWQRPAQLPSTAVDFTGRRAPMTQLDVLCRAHSTVLIAGPPGVGKTALAVHWSHQAASRFPDGCLFANLRGYGPASAAAEPGEVLDRFLGALGTPRGNIPRNPESAAALLRTYLHGRRMLIVLDNAASADQVRPLLPGPGDCRVLVASRSRLSGLTARDGARRLSLEPMPPGEAVALLGQILGVQRVAAEPGAAARIARDCDYLPLALRIAADRAQARPALRLSALATQLASDTDRLDLLGIVDDASAAVRTVFSWSYRALSARPARMFRLLGLYRGQDIGIPAAAALAGTTPQEARQAVDALTAVSLLEECGPDRYRFHDLIRLYAAECAEVGETVADRAAAIRRLLTWYQHTADAADRAGTADASRDRRS